MASFNAISFSFCILCFVLLLSFNQSNGQLRSRPRPRRYQMPCYLVPRLCGNNWGSDDTSTTEYPWWKTPTPSTTSEYPTLPPPPPPPPSKPVNFLGIAETCAANFITQDYDDKWEERFGFGDGSEWSIRLTNKMFVYLMAYNMLESNGVDITENQLEESACFLTTTLNGWSVTNTTGFGGKSVVLKLIRTNLPKVYRFALPYGPTGAVAGTASVILSDNLGYNVLEFCFDNGLRTFAMFVTRLGDNDIEAAKLHLKAIGFKEKHMIDLNPDKNCDIFAGKGIYLPNTGYTNLPTARSPSEEIFKFFGDNSLLPIPSFFWKKK